MGLLWYQDPLQKKNNFGRAAAPNCSSNSSDLAETRKTAPPSECRRDALFSELSDDLDEKCSAGIGKACIPRTIPPSSGLRRGTARNRAWEELTEAGSTRVLDELLRDEGFNLCVSTCSHEHLKQWDTTAFLRHCISIHATVVHPPYRCTLCVRAGPDDLNVDCCTRLSLAPPDVSVRK